MAGFFGYRYLKMVNTEAKNATQNQRIEDTKKDNMQNTNEEQEVKEASEEIKTSDTEIDKELENLDKEMDLEIEEVTE